MQVLPMTDACCTDRRPRLTKGRMWSQGCELLLLLLLLALHPYLSCMFQDPPHPWPSLWPDNSSHLPLCPQTRYAQRRFTVASPRTKTASSKSPFATPVLAVYGGKRQPLL
jgi:hypothetical protein